MEAEGDVKRKPDGRAGVIRAVVGARSAIACEGLRRALASGRIEVVSQVQTLPELLRDVEALAPDVMVLAVSREDLEGAEGLHLLEAAWQRVPVVGVWLSEHDPTLLLEAVARGVISWLPERGAAADLRLAVEAAVRGFCVLDAASLRGAVKGLLQERRRAEEGGGEGMVDALTEREMEVLRLIARGMSNGEIALNLGVSEGTVRTHVGHILGKLQVGSRLDAALAAVRRGLVVLENGPLEPPATA